MLIASALSLAVHVGLNGRAAGVHRVRQRIDNGVVKPDDLLIGQGTGSSLRMNTCSMQGLIHINIADADHVCLIEQQRFDFCILPGKQTLKRLRRKIGRQRLQPQILQRLLKKILAGKEQIHRSELPDIGVPELSAVIEVENHMTVLVQRIALGIQAVPPLHPQMADQHESIQQKTQKLAAPLHRLDCMAFQHMCKYRDIVRPPDNPGQPDGDFLYSFTLNQGVQCSLNGLYLRKFRHDVITSAFIIPR
ncbi:hypothetical protein D3C75_770100 [compost metagenome]